MPNYYAHQVFGRKVFAALPPWLQGVLTGEREGYEAGLYGPDPLFFGTPRQRRMGLDMHYATARPVAQRLLDGVAGRLPYARGYAAGFLCHFALDSRCHPYIERQEALSGPSHSTVETELDRALMEADGLDPLHETRLPAAALPPALLKTVVRTAYPGLSPAGYAGAFRMFREMCRMQTLLAGNPLRQALLKVDRCKKLTDVILPVQPDPRCQETTAALRAMLEEEAAPTALALERFFLAAETGEPLDSWYDRPFEGFAPAAPVPQH